MPPTARKPPKHPALKRLGTTVRQIREGRGLSQEALADAAGVGRSYMSGIERGVRNCSARHLLRLAGALHISVGDLFPQALGKSDKE